MSKITLTAAMIKSLAAFAAEDGGHTYTFDYGYLPENDKSPEYLGTIAFLAAGAHGAVAIDRVLVTEESASSCNATGGVGFDGWLMNSNQDQVIAAFHEHAHTGEKKKSGAMPYTEEMKLHLMQLIINDDIEGLHRALNSSANLIQG